jgi:hypothetical protein
MSLDDQHTTIHDSTQAVLSEDAHRLVLRLLRQVALACEGLSTRRDERATILREVNHFCRQWPDL